MSNQVQSPQQTSPARRGRSHRKALIAAAAVLVAGGTVGGMAAAGVFSPGSVTIHGTVQNTSTTAGSANMWTPDGGKRCTDPETIRVVATTGGRTVTVATGHTVKGYQAGDASYGECISDFTIGNVPSYASYGFQIDGVPGTANATKAQVSSKTVQLSIGG